MSGPQHAAEELTTARAVVRDTLGGQMVEKASDAYGLAVYRRSRAPGAEALALRDVRAPAAATVVEFRDESPATALPRLTERPDWAREKAAVESLATAGASGAPVRLRTVLRQNLVEDTRAAGYQRLESPVDELELRMSWRVGVTARARRGGSGAAPPHRWDDVAVTPR